MNAKLFFKKMSGDGLSAGVVIHEGEKHTYFPPSRKKNPWLPRLVLIVTFVLASLLVYAFYRSILRMQSKPSAAPAVSVPATPGKKESDNEYILQIILEKKDPEVLDQYLKQFRYRDTSDEYGWTALHWAVLMKNSRIYYILIQNGANPDTQSTREWYIFPAGSTPREIARALNFFL